MQTTIVFALFCAHKVIVPLAGKEAFIGGVSSAHGASEKSAYGRGL